MPKAPAATPSWLEPWAWAASSTSQIPWRRARSRSSPMRGEIRPPMWTATTPAVFAVSALSTSCGRMPKVSGSMSTSTGRPPAWTTAAAVAKKVLVGTSTSRPATPSERRMISSALVPLLTATAWRVPQSAAKRRSSSPSASTALQARSSGRNWMRAAGTVRAGASTGAVIGRVGMLRVLSMSGELGACLRLAVQADQHYPGDDQRDAGPAQRWHRLLEKHDAENGGDDVFECRQGQGDAHLGPRQHGQEQKVEQGIAHRAGDHPGVREGMPEIAGKVARRPAAELADLQHAAAHQDLADGGRDTGADHRGQHSQHVKRPPSMKPSRARTPPGRGASPLRAARGATGPAAALALQVAKRDPVRAGGAQGGVDAGTGQRRQLRLVMVGGHPALELRAAPGRRMEIELGHSGGQRAGQGDH